MELTTIYWKPRALKIGRCTFYGTAYYKDAKGEQFIAFDSYKVKRKDGVVTLNCGRYFAKKMEGCA